MLPPLPPREDTETGKIYDGSEIRMYRVTKVLGDKLLIQGRNGCYIVPESRVCPRVLLSPCARIDQTKTDHITGHNKPYFRYQDTKILCLSFTGLIISGLGRTSIHHTDTERDKVPWAEDRSHNEPRTNTTYYRPILEKLLLNYPN